MFAVQSCSATAANKRPWRAIGGIEPIKTLQPLCLLADTSRRWTARRRICWCQGPARRKHTWPLASFWPTSPAVQLMHCCRLWLLPRDRHLHWGHPQRPRRPSPTDLTPCDWLTRGRCEPVEGCQHGTRPYKFKVDNRIEVTTTTYGRYAYQVRSATSSRSHVVFVTWELSTFRPMCR